MNIRAGRFGVQDVNLIRDSESISAVILARAPPNARRILSTQLIAYDYRDILSRGGEGKSHHEQFYAIGGCGIRGMRWRERVDLGWVIERGSRDGC